jgi:hypothetical protein
MRFRGDGYHRVFTVGYAHAEPDSEIEQKEPAKSGGKY